MTLVSCPSCGRAVSHLAEECVHCGYDLVVPPPADVTPAAPRRVRRGVLVLGALAAAVGVLAVLGTLASMASPRLQPFAAVAEEDEGWAPTSDEVGAAEEAGEMTAVEALSMVLELQEEHFAHNGTYTANLTDPAAGDFLGGWSADAVPAGYSVVVLEADTAELCVQASPDVDAPADARAMTIDEQGTLREGAACTDDVAMAAS
jgi:rRNA maturation protein Nop10